MDKKGKKEQKDQQCHVERNAVEQMRPDNSCENVHKEASEDEVKKGVKILNPDPESMDSRG